ncbi:MAG: response regulator transcription factor [Coriobacteriia bacterium]|nr:response regulator transcription factor [Coriobacteriia bacterium]MCL2750250.1 response regulator transcription factor [Coriobacteriia bacterium]
MTPEILLVDDNEEILAANRKYLTERGFLVTCANTGIKAITCINEKRFDCVVLDILLPDLDGFALCKAARTITDTPILFLSCLDEPDYKVKGLMSGADDYMTKPYSLKELAARILTLMRRTEHKGKPQADFYIDRDNRIVHLAEKNILLSQKEFDLFMLFFDNPDTVFSKQEILEKIWRSNAEIGVVAVWVLKLRRKLECAEDIVGRIESRYGIGYCLVPAKQPKQPKQHTAT